MIAAIIRTTAVVVRAARVKEWLPKTITNRVRAVLLTRTVAKFPDRRFLEDKVMPALAALNPKRVLFVGCEPYTKRYERFFPNSEYWTTDIKEDARPWGSTTCHVVSDMLEIDRHFEKSYFDMVILNGVYGFGVNEQFGMLTGICAVERLLASGSVLMLGWNTHLVEVDPVDLALQTGRFQLTADLGFEKVEFETMHHCFAILRKVHSA